MAHVSLPKVLCVDDEPGLLRSLRWLLRGQYEVAVARNARDGLALLSADNFDVIISDQRMPGMTGTEFLERARRASPRSVRLLLTGYSDFSTMLSSVNDGEVFRFIVKPWDNQKLLETIGDAAHVARMTQASWVDFQDTANSDAFDEEVLVFDADSSVGAQWKTAARRAPNILYTDDIGEVVNHLASQKLAVLITDIQGGRSQQMDLIRAVRRNRPQVVVLVYSQERDSAVVGRLINEGQIHRFIAKPAHPEHLNRMLRSAITRHRQLQATPGRASRHHAQVSEDLDFELDFASAAGELPPRVRAPLTGARTWLHRLFN